MVVVSLIEPEDIGIILPLLSEADPSIPKDVLESRLQEMVEHGYECAGIYDGESLVGICGLWSLVKYYVGLHIEPDNVYIKPEYRSQGVGASLAEWLEDLAKSRGCEAVELNCYMKNERGKKYWESNGYQFIGAHYQKKV